MSNTERTQFGSWIKLESLGQGGQGQVLKVQRSSGRNPELLAKLNDLLPDICRNYNPTDRFPMVKDFVTVMKAIHSEANAPIGALKILHPLQGAASAKALGRMERELAALRSLKHPSLVNVLDASIQEKWFVMEYFSRGTLSGHIARTRGDILGSLLAFRPLVDAVSQLHEARYIHRDIKPDNVFVGDDGRLMLGDFGLVINPSAATERLTDTYENVGSKEWMPGWALGIRMDDVQPTFDVFCLGKLFWAMLSGQPFLRLWYYAHPEFDVEAMFPGDPAMCWAKRVFRKCIVEHEKDCMKDAKELLKLVDELIDTLQIGGQFLRSAVPFRCRICGIGQYSPQLPSDSGDMHVVCSHCGHMETFSNPRIRPAWK
ncbi:MAG: protein kinase [Candidatus Solibacter sp.]